MVLYILSIGGALAISAGLVAITGNSWQKVFGALLDGAFLAEGRWGNTLTVAAPLLLVALGMVIGVKAGLFNIGQEGQLLMGAMAMAFVGTKLAGPGPVLLVFGLVMGVVAGGAYAGIAGCDEVPPQCPRGHFHLAAGVHCVPDRWVCDHDRLVSPRHRPGSTQPSGDQCDHARGNSASGDPDVRQRVPHRLRDRRDPGVWCCLCAGSHRVGFRFRLLGSNPNVAQKMGVAANRTGGLALFLSGGFAGLAGAIMLAGGSSGFRLTTGFATNIGWQGLLVALVAASNALASIVVAILFAALRTGSGFLASTGVDRKIVDVVQALLVLALLIPPAIMFVRRRRKALAMADEEIDLADEEQR